MAANLTNLPTQANMSAVTQAAKQSPSMQGGNISSGGAYSSGGSSNPSTSLNVAGAMTPNALQQIVASGKMAPMNIPGPAGGSSGSQGGGPGGIQLGAYDAKSLSQDQRQWLWEKAGHKGTAPMGYGGENPNAGPALPQNFSNIKTQPVFTPAPTNTPSASMMPRSTSGATAAPQSLSTGGGTSGGGIGMPSQALTQAGQATKGLQMPSLPSGVANIMKAITGGAGQIGQDVSNAVGTFAPALKSIGSNIQQATSEVPIISGKGLTGQPIHQGASGTPDIGFTEKLAPILNAIGLGGVSKGRTSQGGSSILDAAKTSLYPMPGENGFGTAVQAADPHKGPLANQIADVNLNQLGTKNAITSSQMNQQGGITQTPVSNPKANQATLQGTLDPVKGIQSFLSGKSDLQKTASAIATPQAQQTIVKQMNSAVKSGDMNAVTKLADLHQAVQQQLDFINRIGQIVTALSAGFGTPNAPGVTEARMPMIETGIGQGLTSMPSAQMTPNQDLGSEIPYLPNSLQTANPVQQQRPPLNPFMGQ